MRASCRKYYHTHPDARRSFHSKHYEQNKDRVIARVKKYHKTEAGKRATRISGQRSREKFPEKIAARSAVGVAIAAGKLTKQPCERCGAEKVHAHHDDYSKPLQVRWLCPPCHRKEHRNMKGSMHHIVDGSVAAIDGESVEVADLVAAD